MFHLYDEVLLIEEHLLLLLSLYILYRACGFTVPRSKRKVLQNLCCQNCNNGTVILNVMNLIQSIDNRVTIDE